MKHWRPKKGWVKERNIFFEIHQPLLPYYKTRQIDYEAGADALLEAIKGLGEYTEYGKPTIIKGMTENNKGWLVFIEDEEAKDVGELGN